MEARRVDLDGVPDGGVDDRVHTMTVRSLVSGGRDQLGGVVGEWQGDAPDAINIETWVWAIWHDHRIGEFAGELNFVF